MSVPSSPDAGSRHGAHATTQLTVGATATRKPGRKRRVGLILLLAMIGLIALAGIVFGLANRGGTHTDAATTTPSTAKASPSAATGSGSPSTTSSAGGGAQPAATTVANGSTATAPAGVGVSGATGISAAPTTVVGSPSATTAGSPPVALVGGGGVTPTALSGALTATGSIGDVLFPEGAATLDAPAQAVITAAADLIRTDHATNVTVTGYTDEVGNATANETLSLQRAQAVIGALKQQLPGSAMQFKAVALGQSQAIATNDTPAGRQLNRRVTIQAQS